ncbi:MAG TPA: hypothetical protein VFA20_22890 [Myxococcaceae bacterium]|nr:hypothetical protein [Myxococcaceae bacterium]
MARALFVLVVLFAWDAFGKPVEVSVPGALDLATLAPAELGKGDLSIQDGVLRAPQGIRFASAGPERLMLVPLVMDVALVVRAADGREFRVTVLADAGRTLMMDVAAPGEAAPKPPAQLQGTYVLAAMSLDGLPTDMALPPLRLREDGSYQLGSAKGRWDQEPRWVTLDGYYASWGRAEIAEDGEQLRFRFRRGAHLVQAVLQRVEEVPERALVATP